MIRALTMEDLRAEGYSEDMIADIEDLNAGRITYNEYYNRQYKRTQKKYFPELMKYYRLGKWQEFIDLTLSVPELMPIAFDCGVYDAVPDELKYQFAIDAYIHHGDEIPVVRKAVREAARYGKAALPAELASRDAITVYRAGEEDITKAKYRISWTTDIKIAMFFLTEYRGRHARFLYCGRIRPADIIAYCDDREEKEVMQYGKVFNIWTLTELETAE